MHISGPRPSKTPPKFNEKTPRDTKRTEWWRERKKCAKYWQVRRRGGSSGGWSGAGWSWRVHVDNNHNDHNHNNTNTARNVEAKPRISVVLKGVRGEGPLRVGSRRVGPKGSGPLPGFRVWVCRVWGSGLKKGLWVFWVGFHKI